MKDAHQKLTKKFVYSLPEGTILLSTIHFPFGFLSWEIKDYYRSLWEEIKSFGADQRMAVAFNTKEDYDQLSSLFKLFIVRQSAHRVTNLINKKKAIL